MKRDAAQQEAQLAALFDALRADPRAHDYFAVLRRLEALRPQWPRVGTALRPSQEALRLGQDPELDFAPAALHTFEAGTPAAPRLGVRFFGLLGPQGPMPLHLTEYVRERLRYRGDAAPARFLDIFHHRLLALFYRAWAQAQPAVHADRPESDRFACWLGSACGDDPGAAGALPREAQLFQAGLLGARSRHPEGLAKLLSNFFAVPVRIQEHVAQWLPIDADDRTRLGHARNRPERGLAAAARLGVDANGGRKVRDRQYKFRVAVGPLTLARYLAFLPGGAAWAALRGWVQRYTGLDLRWDVQLVLAAGEVPEPRLGRRVQLGVTTWIGRTPVPRQRGDLHLRPDTSFLLTDGARHA